jgi:hypothetical protein
LDARTGKISGHGTLSEFRKPHDALDVSVSEADVSIKVRDNFVSVHIESETAQEAFDLAADVLDRLCQCISVQTGQRVSSRPESFEDALGNAHAAYTRKTVPLFTATIYNLRQLQAQLCTAFQWSMIEDERAKKALYYFEHAHLLSEFSKTLPVHSPHAVFSLATAFLQMFKALVTIIGESGKDADYQRRAKQLGLAEDFWTSRVKPLYKIRNDGDVAHYSLATPELAAAYRQFSDAGGVFRDAFAAFMASRKE